jgi:hypothetical protein
MDAVSKSADERRRGMYVGGASVVVMLGVGILTADVGDCEMWGRFDKEYVIVG